MLGLKDLFPTKGPNQNPNAAPYFEQPQHKIVAVEHPCVVKNTDKGLKSFGRNPNYGKVSASPLIAASIHGISFYNNFAADRR